MADSETTYLSLEEVNELLPDNLKIDIENRIERSIYFTAKNKPLPVLNSKLYPEKYYWYSSLTKYFKEKGAEYICFVAGRYGILVIPIDVVAHYNLFSGWKGESKKGRQYHVRIKHNDNGVLTFWNFNESKENIELTDYFIKKP